jgi:hypothetical protein
MRIRRVGIRSSRDVDEISRAVDEIYSRVWMRSSQVVDDIKPRQLFFLALDANPISVLLCSFNTDYLQPTFLYLFF